MGNSSKRLRIFAGPNGSGKSTLAYNLKNYKDKRIKLGVFINADEIEQILSKDGSFSLNKYYRFKSSTKELRKFIKKNGISYQKLNEEDIEKRFTIKNNIVFYKGDYNSYIVADLAAFIRKQLLLKGKSFSFETVFSHESKLDVIKEAKELGYRIYFYFLTTDDPEINVNRVNVRVEKKGHPVPKQKIIDRYYRSLGLLYDAVILSDRAFLFDNSINHYKLVAEITDGKEVEITPEILKGYKNIPNWFVLYIIKKAFKKALNTIT